MFRSHGLHSQETFFTFVRNEKYMSWVELMASLSGASLFLLVADDGQCLPRPHSLDADHRPLAAPPAM